MSANDLLEAKRRILAAGIEQVRGVSIDAQFEGLKDEVAFAIANLERRRAANKIHPAFAAARIKALKAALTTFLDLVANQHASETPE